MNKMIKSTLLLVAGTIFMMPFTEAKFVGEAAACNLEIYIKNRSPSTIYSSLQSGIKHWAGSKSSFEPGETAICGNFTYKNNETYKNENRLYMTLNDRTKVFFNIVVLGAFDRDNNKCFSVLSVQNAQKRDQLLYCANMESGFKNAVFVDNQGYTLDNDWVKITDKVNLDGKIVIEFIDKNNINVYQYQK